MFIHALEGPDSPYWRRVGRRAARNLDEATEVASLAELLVLELRGKGGLGGEGLDLELLLARLEGSAEEHLGADGDAEVGAPLEEDGLSALNTIAGGVDVVDSNHAAVLGVLGDDLLDEGLPDELLEVSGGDDLSVGLVGGNDVDGLTLDLEDEPVGEDLVLVDDLGDLGEAVESLLGISSDGQVLQEGKTRAQEWICEEMRWRKRAARSVGSRVLGTVSRSRHSI
jgi:hypothetical protein